MILPNNANIIQTITQGPLISYHQSEYKHITHNSKTASLGKDTNEKMTILRTACYMHGHCEIVSDGTESKFYHS